MEEIIANDSKEILKELKEIKNLLHIIAGNTEQDKDLIIKTVDEALLKALDDISLK